MDLILLALVIIFFIIFSYILFVSYQHVLNTTSTLLPPEPSKQFQYDTDQIDPIDPIDFNLNDHSSKMASNQPIYPDEYEPVPQTTSYRRSSKVPNKCPPGTTLEKDGLCYQSPKPGYNCWGKQCTQKCPENYVSDRTGTQCLLSKNTVASYNQECPWYDKCGLAAAKGCSKCPPGFERDGCLCHEIIDRFERDSYIRSSGLLPTECNQGYHKENNMCYTDCKSGYVGNGEVCHPIG